MNTTSETTTELPPMNGQQSPAIGGIGIDQASNEVLIYTVFTDGGVPIKEYPGWCRALIQIKKQMTPDEFAAELEGVARQIREGGRPGSRIAWNDELFDESKTSMPA